MRNKTDPFTCLFLPCLASNACDDILDQVFHENSYEASDPIGQEVTSVYCVRWSGTKDKPKAHRNELKNNNGNGTLVQAYGNWGESVIIYDRNNTEVEVHDISIFFQVRRKFVQISTCSSFN